MSEAPFNPGTPPSDLPVKDTLPISPNEIRLRQFVKSAFVVTEGSLGIHRAIFDYAVARDLLPDVEIPRKIPKYMLTLFPPGQHAERAAERIHQDRAFVWNTLYESKAKPKGVAAEKFTPLILDEILGREFRYQLKGRPKRGPENDAYESYLRKFVVLGETTGSSITDQLCLDLKPILEALRREPFPVVTDDMISPETLSPLPQLVEGSGDIIEGMIAKRLNAMGNQRILSLVEALWERNHPGQKFFPEAVA